MGSLWLGFATEDMQLWLQTCKGQTSDINDVAVFWGALIATMFQGVEI